MVKAYDHKLKRHGFPVMAVYSPHGIEGTDIVSAASDSMVRGKHSSYTFFVTISNNLKNIVWRHDKTKYQQIVKCQK